jgi:putative hydrolases of HD superfamily
MSEVQDILAFFIEVEKLKAVVRRTSPIGLARRENSAEHSWHVCLLAVLMQQHSNAKIDLLKVLKMLIVHDLGEIDAGDTVVYSAQADAQLKEEAGMRRLCKLLPQTNAEELMVLWLEFNAGETPEAQFARAMDRAAPIVQNLQTNGQTWRPLGISYDQVMAKNSVINNGCADLWSILLPQIQGYFHSK